MLGALAHWPGLTRPRLAGFQVSTEVIRHGGRDFATGKTVEMEGIVELKNVPRWRVVGRLRTAASPNNLPLELDRVLDSVCYFQLKTSASEE